jgi:hypothetical protein
MVVRSDVKRQQAKVVIIIVVNQNEGGKLSVLGGLFIFLVGYLFIYLFIYRQLWFSSVTCVMRVLLSLLFCCRSH